MDLCSLKYKRIQIHQIFIFFMEVVTGIGNNELKKFNEKKHGR